ncbi:MAG: carboxypeptidase-like regulatory domain-containing protein, partial [Duncaniella sp.]|nr:carboxypeptidase-like regulatory domain-containing protein [Duncaniella sp.]
MEKKKIEYWLSHWRLLLVALFVGLSASAWGQEITQNGVIVDQEGEPIIGASVMVKGSNIGVATDIDGKFTLKCKNGSMLHITSIGYKPLDVKASGSPLELVMQEDTEVLDEVVVVGYGTMSKKHIAGSMSSVDEKTIEQKSPVSVLDLSPIHISEPTRREAYEYAV